MEKIIITFAIFAFLTISLPHYSSAQTDQTIVPRATGKDVVDASLKRIEDSGIFIQDHFMMRRIAWVESDFGTAAHTFRPDFNGGIWQLSEEKFNRTKSLYLSPFHVAIGNIFQINWTYVTWEDCLKPFYSALSARLYLQYINPDEHRMPGTLQAQAQLWYNNYTINNFTKQDFEDKVKDLESQPECEGRFDVCIVLDGSGSIEPHEFQLARQFVEELIKTFSFENVRVGFLVYSNIFMERFAINNTLTRQEMLNIVFNTQQPQGRTYTNEAMLLAVDQFKYAPLRPGIPKIMIVLTDGESNGDPLITGPKAARDNNITTMAVGIGDGAVYDELVIIANGDVGNVYTLEDFDALAEFFYKLNYEVCEVPQEPEVGEEFSDSLVQDEKRYYRLSIPEDGVTVRVNTTEGSTRGFYSYTHPTPNSALNDGVISTVAYIRRPTSSVMEASDVFVAIQGVDEINDYAMVFEEGNTAPPAPVEDKVGNLKVTGWLIFTSALVIWFGI